MLTNLHIHTHTHAQDYLSQLVIQASPTLSGILTTASHGMGVHICFDSD